MSLMDKIKSFFGGSSSDASDPHAGHDHSAEEYMPEAAPSMPPADPAGMPMSEPEPTASDEDEGRPA
ncbi:MAG: hypothetical protein ACRDNB_02305 [Gaiellaceae bacterium]